MEDTTQEHIEEQVEETVEQVKETVEEVEETVGTTVEDIKEDISKLKNDVVGVAESVSASVTSKVEAVSASVTSKVEQTTSSAKATIAEIKNEVKQAVSGNPGCPYSMNGEFSLCGQLCKVSKVIQKNPSFECVKKIVLWDDIIQTGILFAIINLVFILVTFCNYSIISLFGYTAFTVTIASLLFHLISLILSKYVDGVTLNNPVTEQLKTLSFHIHEAVIEKQVTNVSELVNTILTIAKDVFGCKSMYLSAQFAIVFYVIGCTSKCLSNTAILYSVFFVSFVLPKVYTEKKEIIDQQLAKVGSLLKEPLSKIHTLIPSSSSTTTSTTTKKSN